MQGVEILTSAQVVAEWAFNWTVFWITFVAVFSICLILSIWYVVTDQCEWAVIPALSIAGIIIGSAGGCGLGNVSSIPTAYETQYKVTVSDEVSMAEFYEHYTIIEQDGKIFTIKENNHVE